MTEHEEIQADLPDYHARRLAPARARALEQHLKECLECRLAAEDLRDLEGGLRSGGEALFGMHPEPDALRRLALPGAAGPDAGLRGHLDACATCSLELETWRRLGLSRAASSRRPSGGRLPRSGLALAAGLILGLVLSAGLHRSRPGPEPTASGLGQPVLHLLPEILRDGEPARREWILGADDSYISIAFPVVIPGTADATERYSIALRRETGHGVVWSTEMTAGRMREHMQSADVVNIPDVPTRLVPAGSYELLVRSARDAGAAPIYRAVVTISYRQSPAATNAPQ